MVSPYMPGYPGSLPPEHLDAFHVVKSIVRDVVESSRLALRSCDLGGDSIHLLDGDEARPFCRLRFGEGDGVLELFEQAGTEVLVIRRVEDLYEHAERLQRAAMARRMENRTDHRQTG